MQKRNTQDGHKRDDEAQSKRFIDTARDAGADETEEGADRAFRKATNQSQHQKKPK
jgi:hypothetical protein